MNFLRTQFSKFPCKTQFSKFPCQTQFLHFQGDRSSQPSPSDDKSSQDIRAIDDLEAQIDPLDNWRLSQTKTDDNRKQSKFLTAKIVL